MRILHWHVHGSWTTAFVQGPHTYLLPVTPERGPYGLGRARTWDWPASAEEVPTGLLREADVDVVVLQRPEEVGLCERWLGRRPGVDLPAVYVEHNTPRGAVPDTEHPLAGREDIPVVHVTHYNEVMWDCGRAPTTVIEHGIVDPGRRYTGELARAAVVVNDPVRRWRVTGTDLLPRFLEVAPLDVFGMRVDRLTEVLRARDPATVGAPAGVPPLRTYEDLPQGEMHAELARRRVYVHPLRWTSLGLSLLEAMHLGLPVVALDSTEVSEAVPPGAGVVSTRVDALTAAVRWLVADAGAARELGLRAREAALARYGLARFIDDWDRVLQEVTR
jgi:glycosyltransferase involved in cell wall biosynthesis